MYSSSSSVHSTIIHWPQLMTDRPLPPKLQKVGDMWRVTYGSIVKEHRQDWQAIWHYEQLCEYYRLECDRLKDWQ